MKKEMFLAVGCVVTLLGALLGVAETTIEMDMNAAEALHEADAALNTAYKEVMAVYGEPQQEALRLAQRAWIKYRDACADSEGSLYEGGSLQSVARTRSAVALTEAQTELLRALLPGAIAALPSETPDPETLREARVRAETYMEKVYADYRKDYEVPDVVEAQKTWETFRDLWVTAEMACYPADAATTVKERSLAALNSDRAERLKELFMEGYKEEEASGETADLAFEDPPLMKAVAANDLDAVKRLIERGANVNEVNDADYTALHVAAEKGNATIVALLLGAGARNDLYDFDGRTAADVAREWDKPHIARMIEEFGAPSTEQKPPEPQPQATPAAREEARGPEPVDLEQLLDNFGNLTELRQDQWNRDNEWKHIVRGAGEVSEVNRTGFLSEITDAEYEVTCELRGGDRAVLYLDKNHSDFVLGLEVGETITFTGKLKNMQDWGFWCSGYVKVD